MECNIYDTDLNRVGVLYTWVSMVWEESYNDEGSFQLELQQIDSLTDLLQVDRYCGIPDSDTLMIIKAIEISDGTVLASGYPATHILADRVSTTVISNQPAETALRALISSMDAWPGLELGDPAGISDTFTAQKSNATLLEYCQIISQAVDMGFRLRHDKARKKLLFECYKPEANPNAKYSSLYGNMGEIRYSVSSANYKNVAVVAGAGEGADRITVLAGATDMTGFTRREMYVDARQEQMQDGETESAYRSRLTQYGEEQLVGQVIIEQVSCTVDAGELSLGDLVYCSLPELGVKLQVRVTGLTMTSELNGTTWEASLGTPIVLRRRS